VSTSTTDLTNRLAAARLFVSFLALLVIASACGGSQVIEADSPAAQQPAATATPLPSVTPIPAPTATSLPAATSVPVAEATPAPSATPLAAEEPTSIPADPVETCQRYVGGLSDVLLAASDQLIEGSGVAGQLADGSLTESAASPLFAAISVELAQITAQLLDLGDPPEPARPAAELIAQSLARFTAGYELQAQGAAAGDATLIDDGSDGLEAGDALLAQVSETLPECANVSTSDGGTQELATPEEFDLTVFFRTADSLLSATDSPYAGTAPEVLVESAQASCRVLLAGGDIRTALEAAIAESPAAGQPFGSEEQQYVLFVVTRGVALWCPDAVADQDAFTAEVISTIVDVFFDS